jgi:hypothetical protein
MTRKGLIRLAPVTALHAIVSVAVLTGCATDAQKTKTQGALAGAAMGGAAGALAGGKKESIAGAVVGGIAGVMYGTAVAKKKAELAQREDALKASAAKAEQLAQEMRQNNAVLTTDIEGLEQNILQLKQDKLSQQARNALAQSNRERTKVLLSGVDLQLQIVKAEIGRQQALYESEERLARESKDNSLNPGMQLVAAGVRDLQSHERSLELAKAQLERIDPQRAY